MTRAARRRAAAPKARGWRPDASLVLSLLLNVALLAASHRMRSRPGELKRRKGAASPSDSALMVRSPESSIIEITSLSRVWKPAQASAVLRSR